MSAPKSEYKNITVNVGSYRVDRSGNHYDNTADVTFKAKKLAECTNRHDQNRWENQTLYKTEDNRLIIHLSYRSQWQGEADTDSLVEVKDPNTQLVGKYSKLGKEAGFGRPLTLDEYLDNQPVDDELYD